MTFAKKWRILVLMTMLFVVFLWSTQDYRGTVEKSNQNPEYNKTFIYSTKNYKSNKKGSFLNQNQSYNVTHSNFIQSLKVKKPYILSKNQSNAHNETFSQFQPSNTNNKTSLNSKQHPRIFRIAWHEQDPEIRESLSKYDPTKCKIPNCLIEKSPALADIVVLRHSHLPFNRAIAKKKGQLWVLYSSESQYHTLRPPKQWADKIDLSASYMETADFYVPLYGRLLHNKTYPLLNYTGVLANKTKDAVWVSSHCSTPSRRENLVNELSKYLTVDIYGQCGTKKCGTQYDDYTKCKSIFEKDYKFYLAFENSICNNYTSEKLYSLYRYHALIIPVINGPQDAGKYLPKGTYINSLDFNSPKELAEKLKHIGSNETEYIRYLQEKDKYVMKYSISELIVRGIHKFQCDMCIYLSGRNNSSPAPNPKNWQRIFDPSVHCIPGI